MFTFLIYQNIKMDRNQKFLICLLSLTAQLIIKKKNIKKRRKRRWQTRPINQLRSSKGQFQYFLRMKEIDLEEFHIYTRMSRQTFNDLLILVGDRLTKHHRRAIPAELKLAMTLVYLAHGGTVKKLAWDFNIGKSTANVIIVETFVAIWECLADFVAPPNHQEWLRTIDGFWSRWNMPNCLGAIDGLHVALRKPPNTGSKFFNYKKFFSLVVMATANDRYEFSLFDVGAYGSQSDAGVLLASMFGERILQDNIEPLDIPLGQHLPGTDEPFRNYFVADEAFPLRHNIMRPYPGRDLTELQEKFNNRLSRARRIVENAFGILKARWQIFHQTIAAYPDTAEKIVLATMALHNFIMKKKDDLYCPPNFVDSEDDEGNIIHGGYRSLSDAAANLRPLPRWGSNNSSRVALKQRDRLAVYLQTTGARQY